MKVTIEKLLNRENLRVDEAREIMNFVMSGVANNAQLAALLTALKAKGESKEEIAGFALAMRDNGIKVDCQDPNAIDVCGTGGDESGTFNISTAVSFVVAGAGVTVAKHGNRSISSKSGSADILTELGVKIDLSPNECEIAINKIGIAFLFAPVFHPAMKFAAPVRKELGFKTIFNVLGPLTNPAQVKYQMTGVYSEEMALKMAAASKFLGYNEITFINAAGVYDEVLLHTSNKIFTANSVEEVKVNTLYAADFGFEQIPLSECIGGTPQENAKIVYSILNGSNKSGAYKTVVANAALALKVAGKSKHLLECVELAKESIASGAAKNKLELLKEL